MYPIVPGDYGFVLLHITPHVNYGTAVVRYVVWDIANASMKDTLTYILSVDSASGITETINENLFHVYPNPAKENFSIITNLNSGFTFSVSDLSGKEIQTGNSKSNFISLSTKNFINGIYSVSVFEKDKFIGVKKISVQH
jgi:hypothetical protein